MLEVQVENEKGLKVFINGTPKIKAIPMEKMESIVSVLELEISKYFNEGQKKDEKRVVK